MRLALSALMVLLAVNSSHGQAFGIDVTTTLEELDTTLPRANYAADATVGVRPPRPNPMFEQYEAVVGPTVGTCAVTAWTTDSADTSVETQFQRVRTILTSLYGDPIALENGRVAWWNDPKANSANSIILSFEGRPTSLIIRYTFQDFTKCELDAVANFLEPADATGL